MNEGKAGDDALMVDQGPTPYSTDTALRTILIATG
jgi:hypothetical protein